MNKAATTTTITAGTPDPTEFAQNYAVTFTVVGNAPGSGTPTGNVTVSDGANNCIATVAAGTCNLPSPSLGAKTLTATYAGDANFNGGVSAGAGHTVNKAATTTTITADTPDPTEFAQNYAVTFAVVANAPGSGTPTGNVTVSDGTNNCTATVAAGTCNLPSTSLGEKTLTATYAGDANFNDGVSAGESHTVNPSETVTTITSDKPDPSKLGKKVTVKVKVTGGFVTPTGLVYITGYCPNCGVFIVLVNGVGECAVQFKTKGKFTLLATYVGDATHLGSTDTEKHTVRK